MIETSFHSPEHFASEAVKDAALPAIESGLASVDLVLDLIEHLARASRPLGVSEIARALGISKARTHRHLRALVGRGYVRQGADGERYEIAARLMVLGEAVRDRFDGLSAMRLSMARLREISGLAVTASALMEDAIVVLEMLSGRNPIEFGVRPGTTLDLHATAHGHIALAFGPRRLLEGMATRPLKRWTARTLVDPAALEAVAALVRHRGWASAPDQMMPGVGALAAPVFDHTGAWLGTLAVVGPSHAIPAAPPAGLVRQVTDAAAEASRALGWEGASAGLVRARAQ